jgi:hypothetical protein
MSADSLALLSGATSAFGSLASGFAARRADRTNEALALAQAQSAEQAAGVARQGADLEAVEIGERARGVMGSQRAAAAASGVDVNTGSPLLAIMDTITKGARDISLARYRGEVQAYGYETEAWRSNIMASQYRQRGRQSLLGGFMGFGQNLLRGASGFLRGGGSATGDGGSSGDDYWGQMAG